MASEITEEEPCCFLDTDAKKLHVFRIIKYQKSLYHSSCSSSNSSTTAASFSSTCSRSSTSLLDLLKEGSTSLGRLFDMEHTSLGTYLRDYSGSPVMKPIFLWGSDTDDGILHDDPWNWLPVKQGRRAMLDYRSEGQSAFASENSLRDSSCREYPRVRNRRLIRTKNFRSFSRFHLSKHGGLRMRLRLKRLRIGFWCRKLSCQNMC